LAADFEGIGYALADLAGLYQGKAMPPRSQGDHLWLGLAAMTGANILSSTTVSGMYTHAVACSMHVDVAPGCRLRMLSL
jgi:hypothetical protein